jgi:hypothetical protein
MSARGDYIARAHAEHAQIGRTRLEFLDPSVAMHDAQADLRIKAAIVYYYSAERAD